MIFVRVSVKDGMSGSARANRDAKAAVECKSLLGDKIQTYLKVGVGKTSGRKVVKCFHALDNLDTLMGLTFTFEALIPRPSKE